MTNLIAYIIIISGAAAWLLTLAKKWGIIEWCQIHVTRPKLNELFRCDFCMSWWTAVILSVAAYLVTRDVSVLIVPFVSTTITRRLL